MYCWGEVKLHELNILVNKDTCCHASDSVEMAVVATAIKHISIGDRVTAILRENGSASVAVREQNLATWRKSKFILSHRLTTLSLTVESYGTKCEPMAP